MTLMKGVVALLCLLTLAAAFALGRRTAPASVVSFREVLEERDPVVRSLRLSAFLRGLGPDDLPEVLEALDAKAVVGVSEEELKLLMLAWARFDAPGAFDWASRQKRAGWRTLAPTAAMYAWGYRDPAAARQALDEVEEGSSKRELEAAFVSGWIRRDDPQGVTDYLASLPPRDERQVWTNWLMKQLLEDGVDAVVDWADAVPEDAPGGFKAIAFRTAVNAVASAQPQRAVAWYEANRESPYVPASGALRAIARRWVEFHDPPALFEWLITLPVSPARNAAVGGGFASWLNRAPDEAQAWLREAPRTAALDPALERLVMARMTISFPEAAEWALRIQEAERRGALLGRLGLLWGRRDPEAVEAWLAETELSEEDREVLLNPARARAAPFAELSAEERRALPLPVRALEARRARQRALAAARAKAQARPPVTE